MQGLVAARSRDFAEVADGLDVHVCERDRDDVVAVDGARVGTGAQDVPGVPRWLGERSGVDVGGDTTSERGEASAIDRNGGRVDLESLG